MIKSHQTINKLIFYSECQAGNKHNKSGEIFYNVHQNGRSLDPGNHRPLCTLQVSRYCLFGFAERHCCAPSNGRLLQATPIPAVSNCVFPRKWPVHISDMDTVSWGSHPLPCKHVSWYTSAVCWANVEDVGLRYSPRVHLRFWCMETLSGLESCQSKGGA